MSLRTARSSPPLDRRIPAVATCFFLTDSRLGFESTPSRQAFPRPLFLAGRVVSERGELSEPTPGETPENVSSLAEHWNFNTATVKRVQLTQGSSGPDAPTIEVATAADVYDSVSQIWLPNTTASDTLDTGIPTCMARGDAVCAQGLQSLLVCSVFGRPGDDQSIPVIQVVGCPAPTTALHRGSPWVKSANVPENLDGRNEGDYSISIWAP